jgi:integrase
MQTNQPITLAQAVEFTFTHRDSWREGKGKGTARINANHCIRILGGNTLMSDIDTAAFLKLSRELKAEGKASGTVNRITAALSTVINELRQNGFKLEAPVYKRQKESSGRPGFYTEDEVNKMLEVAAQHNDGLLMHDSILFAIKTGCRQGEMLKLTYRDIDFDECQITFRDVKTSGSTGNRDHIIHMHNDLVPALYRRLNAMYSPEVFPWLNKDQLLRELRGLQKECGISQDRCWHSLRHTTATWLLERDVPIRAVMGVLNHTSMNTTLRYAKYTDRSIAAAINKI